MAVAISRAQPQAFRAALYDTVSGCSSAPASHIALSSTSACKIHMASVSMHINSRSMNSVPELNCIHLSDVADAVLLSYTCVTT
jgi:hypothetical protein